MKNTIILDDKIQEFSSKDLNLYFELGHSAAEKGEENEALNWYSIGLQIAKKENNFEKEKQFNRLIFSML